MRVTTYSDEDNSSFYARSTETENRYSVTNCFNPWRPQLSYEYSYKASCTRLG